MSDKEKDRTQLWRYERALMYRWLTFPAHYPSAHRYAYHFEKSIFSKAFSKYPWNPDFDTFDQFMTELSQCMSSNNSYLYKHNIDKGIIDWVFKQFERLSIETIQDSWKYFFYHLIDMDVTNTSDPNKHILNQFIKFVPEKLFVEIVKESMTTYVNNNVPSSMGISGDFSPGYYVGVFLEHGASPNIFLHLQEELIKCQDPEDNENNNHSNQKNFSWLSPPPPYNPKWLSLINEKVLLKALEIKDGIKKNKISVKKHRL